MPYARHKRRPRPHYIINLVLGVIVLFLFGATGTRVAGFSQAASANPYGYADYCALENNETVIYGWAADPDAGSLSDPSVTINAGGQAVTVPTNRAGYRDAAVNSWIDHNRTGDPKPGTYGFRAALPGLYKGSHDIITGTVLNVGAGSSVILNINNSSYTDGDANKPFFANDMIPDDCLANQPVSPTPTPTATPTPTSTPTPTQATTTHNDDVDTTVTAGTLAASAAVQSDGASHLHLNYGTSPIKLDQSTSDQTVSGDSATVRLTGLAPATTYSYQVVRTYPDSKTSTSSIQTFSTLGYIAAVHFVDNHNQGIQGIKAVINTDTKTTKTSNDQGTVQFTNLKEGSYTVSYLYHNAKHSYPTTVNATMVGPDEADMPRVVTLNFTINIERTAITAAAPASGSSANPLIIVVAIVLGLAALILLAFALLRRHKQKQEENWYNSAPLPTPGAAAAPPVPPLTPQPLGIDPATPYIKQAPHSGESLKDMVLRSMAEEARRKAQNDKKQ